MVDYDRQAKSYFTAEEFEKLDELSVRKKISISTLMREAFEIAYPTLDKKYPDVRGSGKPLATKRAPRSK